jgi:hypothetical protein
MCKLTDLLLLKINKFYIKFFSFFFIFLLLFVFSFRNFSFIFFYFLEFCILLLINSNSLGNLGFFVSMPTKVILGILSEITKDDYYW